MTNVKQIRIELTQRTHSRLKAQAAMRGVGFYEYVVHLLDAQAAQPDQEQIDTQTALQLAEYEKKDG